jgi:hypothetical protein
MTRNRLLLWALILALISGAVFIQAKYQPHPELNPDLERLSPSSDKKRSG